jgi:hypothetical protein
MITRADLQTRVSLHADGIVIHKPLEGVMLVEFDDLPELLVVAARALQDRRPVDMAAPME